MKLVATLSFCTLVAAVSGCSQSPAPPVALAYANQYGPVETSRFTPCPKIQGVWQLANLSAGTLLKEDGEPIQHFRWFAPKLFDLSVGSKAYIAIDQNTVETVLYLADRIPGPGGRPAFSYAAKTDKELPCLGHGWRQVVTDHSGNEAAARVLGILPERPKKITQTDYFAKTAANELLLATRIDYQGTNAEREPVNTGYWHFLKMPRLHENPKENGFRY